MALPEIGRPLPRAADAFVDDEKWLGYVLSDRGHRGHWCSAFGALDPDALWAIIVRAVLDSDVTEMRTLEPGDAAPAGAGGPVIHFLNGGEVAEVELTEPRLDGLDRIVYAPVSKLRRLD